MSMESSNFEQPLEYTDGRTKQAFKDETDINKILHRAQKTGTLSHLEKYEGVYEDFSDFDFFESTLQLTKGREIFDDLPSEVRREFANSPAAFFAYVNDVENKNDLANKLPGLAAPGRQNIDVSGKTPNEPGPPAQPGPPQGAASPPEADVNPVPPNPPTGDQG